MPSMYSRFINIPLSESIFFYLTPFPRGMHEKMTAYLLEKSADCRKESLN